MKCVCSFQTQHFADDRRRRFAPVPQSSSTHAHSPSGSPIASPHRNTGCAGRQDTAYGVFNVSQTHSRRDPFSIDYGIWPFENRDYETVCTVTNNMLNTELSLWMPLLSEDARRQACVQYRGRYCNCGPTKHSLLWCPAPFKNTFSLLNPEFGTCDPDGSVCETWKIRMRRWRQNAPCRGCQGNNRHNGSGKIGRPRYTHNRGHHQAYHGNSSGMMLLLVRETSRRGHTHRKMPLQRPPSLRSTHQHQPAYHKRVTTSTPLHTDNTTPLHDGPETA